MKTTFLFLLLFFSVHSIVSPQCLSSLPPPACNGTEPLVLDNETLNAGNSKWYYGGTAMLNSLTLNGGTLTVCGDLTVDKFYMDSGTVFIHPGARFVIGSGIGAGLILRGNSSVYNYGTFEIQRNLSLENGYASATKPNTIINATSSAVFRMSNQYFVINNAFSWFVNNGTAQFWGVITDQQSVAGSVCLGNGSATTMAVLINKVQDSYVVPNGTACVYVHQYSQFYGRLTSNNGLLACLGSGHNSDAGCIPWGCQPNNWGAAEVFTGCTNCSALMPLPILFRSFTATTTASKAIRLSWQMDATVPSGAFSIQRSADGISYYLIDSFTVNDANNSHFTTLDKNPLRGNNYYMIKYTHPNGFTTSSKIVQLFADNTPDFTIYPIPFDDKLFISCLPGLLPEKIILTDITGRNIRTQYVVKGSTQQIELSVLDKIEAGVYIIHLLTNKKYMARTIFKK